MFGIEGDNVETVKLFGRRDIDMDVIMKTIFYENDQGVLSKAFDYPYFNDAKELFII